MTRRTAPQTEWGANIQRLLNERGWSQRTLARKANLSDNQISTFINDRHENPKVSTLRRIADAFGVPLAQLFGSAPPEPEPARESLHVDTEELTRALREAALVVLTELADALAARQKR